MNVEDIEQALKDLDREIVDYNDSMSIGTYLSMFVYILIK